MTTQCKNSKDHSLGLSKPILNWMREAAILCSNSDDAFCGGLVIDETSIQPDLTFVKKDDKVELVRFVDLVVEASNFEKLCTGAADKQIATHVLQF